MLLSRQKENKGQSRRKLASLFDKLLSKRKESGFMENKSKEKERAILTVGRPDLEQLSRDERQVFYRTLLDCVIAYAGGLSMYGDIKH